MSTTMTSKARAAAPGSGDWKETLGRVGLIGKGVLFAVIGILAIQLATGDQANASQTGAIQWIAEQPFGKFLLVLMTLALFALAAWRLLDAAMGDPVEGSEASDRVKYAVKGVLYLSLAIASLTITISNWSGSGSSSSSQSSQSGGGNQQATATILEWPGGRWLVGLLGLAVIGYALYQVKKQAIDADFTTRIDVGEDHWISKLGRFGYAARSIVYVMVGWFFLQAAITYDPNQSKGLSGTLQELAGGGFGQFVLWVVAIGLLAYGAFTIAEAKHRVAA
jgi:hypothetical protein